MLVAITRVKNEVDIIEAFVRHNAYHFDRLVISDDGSTDGTYDILVALRSAGLPIELFHEPAIGYEQSAHTSRLLHHAIADLRAEWVMPLDADEFVEIDEGATLQKILEHQTPTVRRIAWHNFVWRAADNATFEPNPVVRMRFRMPPSPDHLSKVLIPSAIVTPDLMVAQGNHAVLAGGQPIPAVPLDAVRLCHFPIRSAQQYAAKVVIGYLQYSCMPERNREQGFHYAAPFQSILQAGLPTDTLMERQSHRYSLEDKCPEPADPVELPLKYQGGPLRLPAQSAKMFTSVLQYTEAMAARLAALSGKLKTPTSIVRSDIENRRNGPRSSPHVFQSFWSGGPLSPYEATCLSSFIKNGHRVELYSYETDLAVPLGVRVCDAAEILNSEDYFVYEQGFGKGSPAGFANLFRYKLLAEKGGWWVDTDVLCLSDDIPIFDLFFARQDAELINNAVMFFRPQHPVMLECFARARRMGRTVRWGETGPYLLTLVAKELGYEANASPASTCYPVHYTEALDLFRPSMREDVLERAASASFVHLWQQMLREYGIQKTLLPPLDSALRDWIDQYSTVAWSEVYEAHILERMHGFEQRAKVLEIEKTAVSSQLETEQRRAAIAAGAEAELAQTQLRLAKLVSVRAALGEDFARVLASRSWRWTAPMRAMLGAARGSMMRIARWGGSSAPK